MALKIAQLGQPVLRQPAKPVPITEIPHPTFQDFIDDMLDTMEKAGGIGLAAPQVFDSRRIFLAAIMPPGKGEKRPRPEVFINPKLKNLSEEKVFAWEGCLSFLELMVRVPRSVKLRIEYLNRNGTPSALEVEGFPARVLQHEYDHLDGVLTIDRAETTKDIVKQSEMDAVLKNRPDEVNDD